MLDWKSLARIWLLPSLIVLIFFTLLYGLDRSFWMLVVTSRVSIPGLAWMTSFRIFSVVDWSMKYYYLRTLSDDHGLLRSNLFSIVVWSWLFGVLDVFWTVSSNLRWRVFTPWPDWLVLQPGNETHLIVFALIAAAGSFGVWLYHRKKYLDIRTLGICLGLLWGFQLLKMFLAPSPAWTDWGYFTFVYPELQASTPIFLVWLTNDVSERLLQWLVIILSILRVNQL